MHRFARLLLLPISVVSAAASAQSSDAALRRVSADLTTSYLETWSTPQAASPAYVARVYAPRIRFYGRDLDRTGLVDEKRRFVRRWPMRRYALRPGTVRVTCDERSRICRVASVLDWRAESPARRAVSRGSSSFEQRVDLSADRPAVVYESGRVLTGPRPSNRTRGG